MSGKNDLIIRVAGESGEGVISTGDFITLAAARSGLRVYTFMTFPAEIKGGNAMFQLRLSDREIHSQGDEVDVFLAFNQESFERYGKELKNPGGVLIYDSDQYIPQAQAGRIDYAIPMTTLAKEKAGALIAKNIVSVGCLVGLFDLPYDDIRELIREKFSKKGEEVLDTNFKALDIGCEYAKELGKKDSFKLQKVKKEFESVVLTGSDAVGLGAIVAGCKAYYGYPITPATDVFKFLAKELPKAGGVVMQMEDEIAAYGGCVGASFGGVKTMTATSGPGVSLMNEFIGYSSMAELPVVLVDVQRGGPSTGLPTKTEQSDLNIALFGSHGESPRAVLAPISVEECFYSTVEAFNLAEEFQMPVMLLTDGFLGGRKEGFKTPDPSQIKVINRKKISEGEKKYQRYAITEDGISPFAAPGDKGGRYTATGLEHSEIALPAYDPETRNKMVKKRFKKLEVLQSRQGFVKVGGDLEAGVAVLSWGSSAGPCLEAVESARLRNFVKVIIPRLLWPLPIADLDFALSCVGTLIVVELNHFGQYAQQLKIHYGDRIRILSMTQSDGVPFKPVQILRKIQEVCS